MKCYKVTVEGFPDGYYRGKSASKVRLRSMIVLRDLGYFAMLTNGELLKQINVERAPKFDEFFSHEKDVKGRVYGVGYLIKAVEPIQ